MSDSPRTTPAHDPSLKPRLWFSREDFRRFATSQLSAESTYVMVAAGIIGVLAGFGTVGFIKLIELVQWLLFKHGGALLVAVAQIPWYYVVLGPALGGLVVGPLIRYGAAEAKGHGVPEVIEALVLRGGIIRRRATVVKALASSITIGSGGSTGPEGPIMQIGAGIGSAVGQLLKVSTERLRLFAACGAAGGLAAIFNAPIAGALFILETVLGDFGYETFSPIVVAAVLATAMSRFVLGDFSVITVPAYALVSHWEFIPYLILGIAAGFAAVFFIRLLYYVEDSFNGLRLPEILKPALGGLLVGLAALALPHLMGEGYFTIEQAISGTLSWQILAALVLTKMLATSVSLGSGGSGGIFAPCLFMGAVLGGALGNLFQAVAPSLVADSGAYAMVGMGAMVAGTTHAPLTAIVILFELTGDYTTILPVMITCTVSTLISSVLTNRESVYGLKLRRKGILVRRGRDHRVMERLRVADVMHPGIETLPEEMPFRQLLERLTQGVSTYYPIVDAQGRMTGILSLKDVRPILLEQSLADLVVAKDIATHKVISVRPSDSLAEAMEKFARKGIPFLPVVAADEPRRLLGRLHRRDVLAAYNQAIIRSRQPTPTQEEPGAAAGET
ncbi:MAG: chloride channel protein [Candidatus Tectomicrobia bacterium]|nr:chloride channel protein [Candidatus Tectomicrobia bacterium]